MAAQRQIVAVAAVVALTSLATRADAEPITATYEIQILQAVQTGFAAPYPETFVLLLTFDRALGGPTSGGMSYGPPTFSPVPLPVPPAPQVDAAFTSGSNTLHSAPTEFTPGAAFAFHNMSGREVVEGQLLSWYTSALTLVGWSPDIDVLTPERFAADLTLPPMGFPFAEYNFYYTVCMAFAPFEGEDGACQYGTGAGSQVALYTGTSMLRSIEFGSAADPIPEPAALVLAGTGLAVLARYRSRMKRAKGGRGA